MTYLPFHDISYAQGLYDMDADPNPVIAMRMSFAYYGSKVLAYDNQAARNYNNAIRTGKVPILYHFAGGGDPVAEADFFVNACSPLADGDILALDYELTSQMNPPADPVGWCLAFAERVHERTGIWPLFYTYASMLQQYGFKPVLANCGLWLADYDYTPDQDIPNTPPYIIHQFTDNGGTLDSNACFLSLTTLKLYAFHTVAPQPLPPPASIPAPVPEPTPAPEPAPTQTPEPAAVNSTLYDYIKTLFERVAVWLKGWKK